MIRGTISVQSPSAKLEARLLRAFTFGNPAFFRALAAGRNVSHTDIPESICAARIGKDGSLVMPRGAAARVREAFAESGCEPTWVDQRSMGEEIEIPHRSQMPDGTQLWLRPYQKTALWLLRKRLQGLVITGCGGGKTTIGIAAIADFARTAIVLVHTEDLLDQWREKLLEQIGIEAGMIAAGKVKPGPVTIAMIQTLVERLNHEEIAQLLPSFGVCILDECFVAGTMVGDRPIEEYRSGDSVATFDEDSGTMVTSTVSATFVRKATQLVRLKFTGNNQVVCTPNHLFLTEDGWVEAQKLSCGRMVRCRRSIPSQSRDKAKRHSEGSIFAWSRVVNVEVLKPGGDGEFEKVCPTGKVYDLEVEKTHTYIANGMVVHNCHHAPAMTFMRVLEHIPARVRLGLTATPKREDGLGRIVDWCFGERLIEVPTAELLALGYLMRPTLEVIATGFSFESDQKDKFRRAALIGKALERDKQRLHFIASVMAHHARGDQTCLVIANRKKYCRELGRLMWTHGVPALVVTSDTLKPSRKRIMHEFRQGKVKMLIATSLANEGLDAPHLSRVCFAWPDKAEGWTDQRVGRLMRLFPKDPRLIDFVDVRVPELVRRYRGRARVYKRFGLNPPKEEEIRQCQLEL